MRRCFVLLALLLVAVGCEDEVPQGPTITEDLGLDALRGGREATTRDPNRPLGQTNDALGSSRSSSGNRIAPAANQ